MNGLLLSKISSEKLLYLDLQFLQLLDFPVRSSKSPDFDFHFFQSFSNLRAFRRLRSIQLKKIQNNFILLFWIAKSSKYKKFHWTKHEKTKNKVDHLDSYKVYNSKFLVLIQITLNETKLFRIQGTDHEVEFHEIKIQLFQEIKFSIMRSKFSFFMRSKLTIILIRRLALRSWDWNPNKHYYKFWSHDHSCD